MGKWSTTPSRQQWTAYYDNQLHQITIQDHDDCWKIYAIIQEDRRKWYIDTNQHTILTKAPEPTSEMQPIDIIQRTPYYIQTSLPTFQEYEEISDNHPNNWTQYINKLPKWEQQLLF